MMTIAGTLRRIAAALDTSSGAGANETVGVQAHSPGGSAPTVSSWQEKTCADCEFQIGGVCRFGPPIWHQPKPEAPGHEPSQYGYPKLVHEKFGTFLQACSAYQLRRT